MNIKEIHESIATNIDDLNENIQSGMFVPGEIDDFINRAQREFINRNRRFIREYNDERKGIEAHEALRTIIEEHTLTSINSTSDLERGFRCDLNSLPKSYDYFISARAYYSTPDHWKTTRIVNRAFINDRSTTLYHQSPVYSETPVHIDNSDLIGLYDVEDAEKPSKLAISYVRNPQDVVLDPNDSSNNVQLELPEDYHRQIVDIALKKIINSVGNRQRNQNTEN
jgi:hypothetical protein